MSYQPLLQAEQAYATCQYGVSPLNFRGPDRSSGRAACAVLGGGLSFGRLVATPWPQHLEDCGIGPVVNLAVPQTSPEGWLHDPSLMALGVRARRRIIEMPGCLWFSNRYYQVHPRRNDRVVRISTELHLLYPELDLSQYLFAGHLMRSLQQHCPKRFFKVAEALRQAWQDRMSALLSELRGDTLLLCLEPQQACSNPDPIRPDLRMIQALYGRVKGVVNLQFQAVRSDHPAANFFPSEESHAEIARQLLPLLR